MKRRGSGTANVLRASPSSGERGTIGTQPAAGSVSSAGPGYPSQPQASTDACSGWFPVKKLVSISTDVTSPGAPRRTSAQSCPGSRRRLVSQPSTISPR